MNSAPGCRAVTLIAFATLLMLASPVLAEVDNLGAYQTSIPIQVPAYHGLEPRIALAYDSNAGNGLAGIGWRLRAGSTIVRVSARHGMPRFDATDVYMLDGDALVVCTPSSSSPSCTTGASATAAGIAPSTAVFYSTKIESYQRIAFDAPSMTWWVWDKAGIKATYVTSNSGRTFPLSSIEDTHGNRVTYAPWCDGTDDCYLERITYAGTTAAAGAEVRFFFEPRPDPIESGTGTGLRSMRYRLKSISVKMAGQLVRAYALGYATSAAAGASVLSSFQQFGRDATVDAAGTITAGATPPLPPMTFETASMGPSASAWQSAFITTQPNLPTINPAPGVASYTSHYVDVPVTAAGCRFDVNLGEFVCYPHGSLMGDWNGDGRSDVLTWGITTSSCTSLSLKAMLTQPTSASGVASTTVSTGITVLSGNCQIAAWTVDLDGDSKDDILLYLHGTFRAAFSRGDGTFSRSATAVNQRLDLTHCATGDVNGDGKMDLVCSDDTLSTSRLVTMRSLGDGSFATTSEFLGPQGVGSMASHRLTLVDVDGDSNADVVIANQTNGTWTLVTALSKGDGTYTWEPAHTTSWTYGTNEDVRLFSGDFDGDGKGDVLLDRIFPAGGADELHVALAAKGASYGRFVLVTPSTPWAHAISIGDVNGDGKDDVLLKDSVTAALANGTGGFDAPPAGSSAACESLHPADVNGDGKADFVCVADDLMGTLTFHDHISPNSGVDVHRWMPADVNGDGTFEFVYVYYRNPGYEVYTIFPGTNTRISRPILPSPTVPGLENPDAARWMPVDVGGPSGAPDGKTDLVYVDKVGGTLGVYTLLSNGDGTWQVRYDTPWKANGVVVGYGAEDLQHWGPAEFNGDGRMDLVHTSFLGPGVRIEYLLSNGDGTWVGDSHDYFTVSTTTPQPLDALTVPTVQDFRLLDVDGDGLTDLVHVEHVGSSSVGTRIRTLLSNGDGTFTPRQRPATVPVRVDARRWRPFDGNGDGMGDLAHIRYTHGGVVTCLDIELLLSQGDGSWAWQTYGPACHIASTADESRLLEDPRAVRFIDVNGDRRTDLVLVTDYWDASMTRKTAIVLFENRPASGGSWVKTVQKDLSFQFYANDPWTWQIWQTPLTGGPGLAYAHLQYLHGLQWPAPSDRLTRLSNGLGASTIVSYRPLTGPRSYLPSGMIPIVSDAVEVSDGAYSPPVTERITYDYSGAQWSDRERRHLGYGERIAKTGELGIRAIYRLSNECGAQLEWSEVRRVSGNTLGALFRATHLSYANPGASAPYTCLLTREERREHELGTNYRVSTRAYDFDAYGNIVHAYIWGNPNDGTDDRMTERPSYANEKEYIVGLPAYHNVYGRFQGPFGWRWGLRASTQYEYDRNTTYAAPPGGLGELRRIKAWNDRTGTYLTSAFDYDAAGNVVKTTDPVGTWTSTSYDATYGLFPEQECNARFCVSKPWDMVLGVPKSVTDTNNQTTQFTFDAFGRPTRVTRPDGSFTKTEYLSWGVTTGPIAQRQRIRTETSDDSADGVLASDAWFDGLGRTYRIVGEGGFTRDLEYIDTSPRVSRQSNPYVSGEAVLWRVFAYDEAKRLVSVQAPDGSMVRTVYAVGSATNIDQLGAEKVTHLDEFGQVTKVEERLRPCPTCPLASYFTTYKYDALARLLSVTDHLGNVSTNDWDSLGRNLQRCDPDRGCQSWTYYDDGKPKTRTDAKAQVTRWSYDTLGRPSKREEINPAGAVTRAVTQIYDRDPVTLATQGHSLGRLLREEDTASTSIGSEAFWYDALGRVRLAKKCIDAYCYEMGYAFDRAGRLKMLTYPDANGVITTASEQVTYTYDAAGRLASVSGYVTTLSYNSAWRPTFIEYANGVQTQLGYNAERLWLDGFDVTHPVKGQHLLAQYWHDPAARIRSLMVHNPTLVELGFDYDELGRLMKVTSPDPGRQQQFSYNAIGNMKWNSQLGDYHYADPKHVHAVTKTDNGDTYAYDANGNMTQARGMTIEWTHDDRVLWTLDPRTGTHNAFAYDASGQRVRKNTSLGTTFYFSRFLERDPAGGLVKYYWAGNSLIARRNAAGVLYYHQDHVHSTRLVTDASGAVANRYHYAAYGAKRGFSETVANDVTTFGARDDDDDTDTALVYMNARWYDPRLGKFLSADSIVPSLYDPQALNRYSYVLNDPMNYWDPSGHMPMRVERKKELEAQSRAAFARVSSGCSNNGNGFNCSVPFDVSWGEILANSTRVRLNAQGQIVSRRVGGGWEKQELPPWSILQPKPSLLSPPPLLSVEQADAPYVAAAGDEWAPFPRSSSVYVNTKVLSATATGILFVDIGSVVTRWIGSLTGIAEVAYVGPLLVLTWPSEIATEDCSQPGVCGSSPPLDRPALTEGAKPLEIGQPELPPLPLDPSRPPGPAWDWRGRGQPGSDRGAWYNPSTGESLHPDPNHPPPIGPHWDYIDPKGMGWRVFPDGRIEPK
jgi:RHS repeat-associated protein